jgi:hypothetical protein
MRYPWNDARFIGIVRDRTSRSTAIQALADAGDGCAGPPKPSIADQWPRLCAICLTGGFYSEFAGMFSDDRPLSRNAARKMD